MSFISKMLAGGAMFAVALPLSVAAETPAPPTANEPVTAPSPSTTGTAAEAPPQQAPADGTHHSTPVPVDTNGDGRADAWDRNGDGKADAWDLNADGAPDAWDEDGDGKPEVTDADGDGRPDTAQP